MAAASSTARSPASSPATTPPVVFVHAADTDRLTAVAQVYGRVDALQMVWPDSTGRLPWETGYRNGPDVQPLLGIPPSH